MLLYVALQAVPARKHTLFPPILALAHAAVESGRAFRPSAVEAATETSTTSAPKTASRFTDDPSDGQIDLIPDQVQPVGTRTVTPPATVRPDRADCNELLRARGAEKPAQAGDAAAR